MDYITQELLRQQTALTALLSGPQARRNMDDPESPANPETDAGAAGQDRKTRYAVPSSREDRDVTAAQSAQIADGVSAQALRQMLERRSDANRAALVEALAGTQTNSPAGVSSGGAKAGYRGSVRDAETAQSADLSLSQAPGRSSYTAFAVESVRDISRTVERDARRYDGGYELY